MKAALNGAQIEFVDAGRGAPVVFVHAFPLSRRMWEPQIDWLKEGFRAIAYDIRGFGQSEVGDGQYTMELFAEDLIALLDHLKIEKAVLCGLSMGGYIVLRAAEKNPDRVSGLILADTKAEADTNEARLKRAAAVKAVKKDGAAAFAETFARTVFTPRTLSAGSPVVETVKAVIRSTSPLGICGALLAMAGRTDAAAFLPTISVPTLILVGEHDALTPPANAKALRNAIPGSELKILPEAAHLSSLENPAVFNQHLLDFLKRRCR